MLSCFWSYHCFCLFMVSHFYLYLRSSHYRHLYRCHRQANEQRVGSIQIFYRKRLLSLTGAFLLSKPSSNSTPSTFKQKIHKVLDTAFQHYHKFIIIVGLQQGISRLIMLSMFVPAFVYGGNLVSKENWKLVTFSLSFGQL